MNDLTHSITRSRTASDSVARGLGWFSIGLGLFELLAPRRLARAVGMQGRERLIRVYGAREITAGIGLLAAAPRAPWLWARVVGDALDAGTLATHWRAGAHATARDKRNTAFALGAVAGIAVADIATAVKFSAREGRSRVTRDYSDRSGFPRPAEQMRGLGRKDGATAAGSHAAARTINTNLASTAVKE